MKSLFLSQIRENLKEKIAARREEIMDTYDPEIKNPDVANEFIKEGKKSYIEIFTEEKH